MKAKKDGYRAIQDAMRGYFQAHGHWMMRIRDWLMDHDNRIIQLESEIEDLKKERRRTRWRRSR